MRRDCSLKAAAIYFGEAGGDLLWASVSVARLFMNRSVSNDDTGVVTCAAAVASPGDSPRAHSSPPVGGLDLLESAPGRPQMAAAASPRLATICITCWRRTLLTRRHWLRAALLHRRSRVHGRRATQCGAMLCSNMPFGGEGALAGHSPAP